MAEINVEPVHLQWVCAKCGHLQSVLLQLERAIDGDLECSRCKYTTSDWRIVADDEQESEAKDAL